MKIKYLKDKRSIVALTGYAEYVNSISEQKSSNKQYLKNKIIPISSRSNYKYNQNRLKDLIILAHEAAVSEYNRSVISSNKRENHLFIAMIVFSCCLVITMISGLLINQKSFVMYILEFIIMLNYLLFILYRDYRADREYRAAKEVENLLLSLT